jgi:hypothetical protein
MHRNQKVASSFQCLERMSHTTVEVCAGSDSGRWSLRGENHVKAVRLWPEQTERKRQAREAGVEDGICSGIQPEDAPGGVRPR